MKIFKALCLALLISAAGFAQNADSLFIRKIYDQALVKGHSYENLRYLCKNIGPRLSGSTGAAKAVNWTKELMEGYGFDTVYLQEVMVPHWERGEKETAYILDKQKKISVPVAALGGSVATPAKGITAQVVEVKTFEELHALGEKKVKGKIVFFNRAFDPAPVSTFISYRGASNQRGQGAIEAAKLGAIGVIVRSMTHALDDNPHTGGMRYTDGVQKIPAAAISTKGANLLSEKLTQDPNMRFYLKQSCRQNPDVLSYNVIGEIRGSEKPEEIITVGGHLDSWDLAEGAHDDGTGCMQAIESLRIYKALNFKPKHTIRAVMFMNEENGNRGGQKYAEIAGLKKEKHLFALESDAGGFTPRGFSIDDNADFVKFMRSNWQELLKPYGLNEIEPGEGGVDIGPLKKTVPGIVLIGYRPDNQRYFDIHHAATDVFENVNKRELELGAASMATLIYLLDSQNPNAGIGK